MRRIWLIVTLSLSLAGCQKKDNGNQGPVASITPAAGAGSAVVAKMVQIAPPLDVKTPPADAIKTPSGLVYKKLKTVADGRSPGRNDTVMVNLSGWRQTTGETWVSNRTRDTPQPLALSQAAKGFVEALALMKVGERAMFWMPAEIGYREKPKTGITEAFAYEIELLDIQVAPAAPEDAAGPPQTALTSPKGTKYTIVRPGTGTEKARIFDTVTFNYAAFDSEGRLFDTSEIKKQPVSLAPMKQSPVLEDMLTVAQPGARVRFWTPVESLQSQKKQVIGVTGQVCYELEIIQIAKAKETPPNKPAELKAPADALKSPKGVAYKILAPPPKADAAKPKPTETVRAKFTGWTAADGHMFDSWAIRGEPLDIALNGTIAGFADTLPLLQIGTKVRLWVPGKLAYEGAVGQPQGDLVYDMELVEIKAPRKNPHDPHGGERPEKPKQPAPPDVAAVPKDAKKTASGLAYKILTPGKGGPKPTLTDRVKVHYAGWQTDGNNFDASIGGDPAQFALTGVIKGWTEGLQLMSPGDKMRFWIPEELAYKTMPSKPQGMLVFDIELLEIVK